MRWLQLILVPFGIVILIALVIAGHVYYNGFSHPVSAPKRAKRISNQEFSKINEKALLLKIFASERKCNKKIFFLVDMSLPSGKNRFFVYNTEKDSVINAGQVAHGHGNNGFSHYAIFSNKPGSSCTALGKYKIGAKYIGTYGVAYKLYGLDMSNSNAFARNIVLHAHDCVPAGETFPYPICNSSGCAMVSPGFLKEIEPLVDTCRQPVLLWVFN
ncbi:MAG TPA: murein L,D-transpeptidase catalytic domain family protein [Puia sp.]|nr:murein L,D-transpeptidase catalytic domain family protein [Puia sp.]